MKRFFNVYAFNDFLNKKSFKLLYFYSLLFAFSSIIFLLTVLNTQSPFFKFAKDERILKNVNHFYPQKFAYFTIRPDSVKFLNVFEVTRDNSLKKINIRYSHSSNYYGLSRQNRYNFFFFGTIYKYIPDKNEIIIDAFSDLNNVSFSDKKFADLTFGKSYFCGRYLLLLKEFIPLESRKLENIEVTSAKYKLVNIKCKE